MADGTDSSTLDERDTDLINDSKIVFFDDDDIEAKLIQNIFTNLQFEYSGMGGKPISYHYIKAKDYIKWNRLKAKDYIPLLDMMFKEFIRFLPTK